MAWTDDEEGLAPDCSHLVHTLYEQAGHPYPYASSLDLYRGTGPFIRVRTPQPGDLIVWRGHVGIVVDPKEHSFFSSVSSGAHIENYRSAYWRSRGYARFYRYLTKSPLNGSGGTSEAASQPLQPKEQGVISSTENRSSLQTVSASPPALAKPRGDGAPNQSHAGMVPTNAARTENLSPAARLQIPLRTGGHAPKSADVTAALEASNLEAGEILRAGNLARLDRPVVVYRQLQVSGVELKGKRGTAQMQVETVATLTAERMESQRGWEDHQLELERTKKGWVMTAGNQSVYVPRDGALRILAARLATLTQSTDRSTEKDREQADIIRFLNFLVE
jgi:NlpC/P60 family protein